jgi:hypothetical protein
VHVRYLCKDQYDKRNPWVSCGRATWITSVIARQMEGSMVDVFEDAIKEQELVELEVAKLDKEFEEEMKQKVNKAKAKGKKKNAKPGKSKDSDNDNDESDASSSSKKMSESSDSDNDDVPLSKRSKKSTTSTTKSKAKAKATNGKGKRKKESSDDDNDNDKSDKSDTETKDATKASSSSAKSTSTSKSKGEVGKRRRVDFSGKKAAEDVKLLDLPVVVTDLALTWLDPKDLSLAASAAREWHTKLCEERVWRQVYTRCISATLPSDVKPNEVHDGTWREIVITQWRRIMNSGVDRYSYIRPAPASIPFHRVKEALTCHAELAALYLIRNTLKKEVWQKFVQPREERLKAKQAKRAAERAAIIAAGGTTHGDSDSDERDLIGSDDDYDDVYTGTNMRRQHQQYTAYNPNELMPLAARADIKVFEALLQLGGVVTHELLRSCLIHGNIDILQSILSHAEHANLKQHLIENETADHIIEDQHELWETSPEKGRACLKYMIEVLGLKSQGGRR